MIVYTIFKNRELIFAQNFRTDDITDAKKRLAETLKDIRKNENITDIKYTENELEFVDIDEKHIMFIKN